MKKLYISISVITLLFSSCNKENSGSVFTSIPSTYTFTNVNYSGQTTRISMLEEMSAYMKTANISGVLVDASVLKNMFSNTGSPFADTSLNTSGKQLKNKCFVLDQPLFESYMDSIAFASSSLVSGSNGTPGVVASTTTAGKQYLFGANGMEYTQIIEKGLMAAVFYYQASEAYLSESGIGMSVDNITVVPGEGTAMQHHWDEAFGYFSAPIDFPSNLTGIKFWSKYSNTVNAVLGCNKIMMDEFKRGRVAINNNNHSLKDNSAFKIKSTWDKIIAASAIHYINESLDNFTDNALRNHALSEAIGFIKGLKYNSNRLISLAEIDSIVGYIGSNLYLASVINLNQAKDLLSSIYGLDSVKDLL